MSNPLYYVAGLVLALSYPLGIEPLRFAREGAGPPAAGILLCLFVLVTGTVHRALAGRYAYRLGLARLALRLLALVLYAILLYVFHFPLWVWSLGLEDSGFLGPLLTLSPLFGFYAVLGLAGARYDPRRHGSFAGATGFAFRSFLGFSLLPVLLMLTLDAAMTGIGTVRRAIFLYPSLGWLGSAAAMLLFVSALPFLLRVVFRARPLPEGELRRRMERICRDAQFRCAGLLVLPTGAAAVANAFIVGVAAPARFVYFTDAILGGMTPGSLECVLAHEIAHSRRRHIQTFFAAVLGFMLLHAAAADLLEGAKVPTAAIGLLLVASGLFFWVGLFGWVSRRFESEADLAAARLAPAAEDVPYGAAWGMAEALLEVAELNRIPPWAWSWRHFSIERRIDLLLEARRDPAAGQAFERRCALWRRGAVALLFTGVAAAGVLSVRERDRAGERLRAYEAYERLDRGERFLRSGHFVEARAEIRAAINAGLDEGVAWAWLAQCERHFGREEEARRDEATALEKGVADPRVRRRLRAR